MSAMSPQSASVRVAMVRGDGQYAVGIVSEPRYHEALAAIAARDIANDGHAAVALLLPSPAAGEPAIAVIINGTPVGYLATEDAATLVTAIADAGLNAAQCAARIVEGAAEAASERSFEVRLDLVRPISFDTAVVVALEADAPTAHPAAARSVRAETPKPAPSSAVHLSTPAETAKSQRRRKLAGTIIVIVVVIVAIVAFRLQQSGPT
jgi:hypothetical protein